MTEQEFRAIYPLAVTVLTLALPPASLSMNISELSPSQLRQAATLKERMAKLQKELDSILGTPTTSATAPDGPKQKRTVSAATRAKMAAAQQKRWAVKQPAKVVPKPKPSKR